MFLFTRTSYLGQPIYAVILVVIMLFMVQSATAKCARSDVDHYLSKGFSTGQIVVLCESGADTPPAENTKSNTPEAAPLASRYNRVDQLFSLSIDAEEVYISDTHLHFSQTKCLEFGGNSTGLGRKAFCPRFDYALAFNGLEILSVKRASLFSKKKIMLVHGDLTIQAEEHEDFKYLKKSLVDEYIAEAKKSQKPVEVPLKADAPVELLIKRIGLMAAGDSRL